MNSCLSEDFTHGSKSRLGELLQTETLEPAWLDPYLDFQFTNAIEWPWECLFLFQCTQLQSSKITMHTSVEVRGKSLSCTDQTLWMVPSKYSVTQISEIMSCIVEINISKIDLDHIICWLFISYANFSSL